MQLQQAYDEESTSFGGDDYALAMRLQNMYDKEREERAATLRHDYEGKFIVI
jgi:hypothetical protein